MIDPTQSSEEKKAPSLRRYLPAVVLVALVLLLTSMAAAYISPNNQTGTAAPPETPMSTLESTEVLPIYQLETPPDATGIIVGAAFLVLVILIGTLAVTRQRAK
jgi:hypothetical protein